MKAHEISKEWVARMTTLVECWNKLDGNVGELSSWVTTKVSHPTMIDSICFCLITFLMIQLITTYLISPGLCRSRGQV